MVSQLSWNLDLAEAFVDFCVSTCNKVLAMPKSMTYSSIKKQKKTTKSNPVFII